MSAPPGGQKRTGPAINGTGISEAGSLDDTNGKITGSALSIDDPPIIQAYRYLHQLWAWCDHEQRWHWHGACCRCDGPCTCPPDSGDGPRVSHCSCERSPYWRSGYVLKCVGYLTDEIRRAHKPLNWSRSCRLERRRAAA